jgi:chromosome segregation ATPase
MARVGATKKKKKPQTTELSQLKEELRRVAEEFESCRRELAAATEQQTATSEILGAIASLPTDMQRGYVRQLMHKFYGSTVTSFA